jgi:hypothetical protein
MRKPRLSSAARQRGVHKSTGGILHPIPSPVDPVDAAPPLDFQHSRSPAVARQPQAGRQTGLSADPIIRKRWSDRIRTNVTRPAVGRCLGSERTFADRHF